MNEKNLIIDDMPEKTAVIYAKSAARKSLLETLSRSIIAIGILIIFTAIVFRSFNHVRNWNEAEKLLDTILPVIGTVAGAAVGFYYKIHKD